MPAYLDRARKVEDVIEGDDGGNGVVGFGGGSGFGVGAFGVTAEEACEGIRRAFGGRPVGWKCEYCETRNERGARCMECGAPRKV